jgi:esterase/lipase superfamily enzyme
MYKQGDLSDAETEISHVVMAAPDVSKDEFDNRFKDEIAALTEKLTTYVSSDDSALLIAEIIDWEKKLGLQAAEIEGHEQFEEAKDLLYLKSLDPDRISIVDVTLINKASYGHGYDLEAPEFYDDFYMRLFEVSPNDNRRLYLVNVRKDVDYWIMR